jgi:hypothetical protein
MNIRKKIIVLGISLSLFFLGIGSSANAQWSTGLSNAGSFELPDATVGSIVANVADWLVAIFAFFGIIGFTVSGIIYLVSTGNDEMITKAKKYMTYSLVGIVVGLSGYVIILAVNAFLNASSF